MKTASERARELNAETEAWLAEDPENRGAGLLVEDSAFWAAANVHTGDELDHYFARSTYSDVYKERHGIRPMHGVAHLTTAEIEAEIEALLKPRTGPSRNDLPRGT